MTKQGPADDSTSTGRMLRDVALYTLARLVIVVALTTAILLVARLIGVREVPLVVALLFAIVISLPLGVWLLARCAAGPRSESPRSTAAAAATANI